MPTIQDHPVLNCSTCGKQPPLCDLCVEDAAMHLRGVAMARGSWWADGVAQRMGTKRAKPSSWPSYDSSETTRTIALSKVANLSRDDRVRDRLARLCVAEAARTWSKRR